MKDSVAKRSGWLRALCSRLRADEGGQDLIEYVLLGSVIAIASVLAFQLLATSMNTSYESWDDAQQSIWEVPDPVPAP